MADTESLVQLQQAQLTALDRLVRALRANQFWSARFERAGLTDGVVSLDSFRDCLPLLTKAELVRDRERHPPYGSNLSRPLADYVRLHQTSSTTGAPLRWLDTEDGWQFLKRGWREVLRAAGVTAGDSVFVAFSFGPFLGLWLAFEAAQDLGALVIPGGAMSSELRLAAMLENQATVLCCTPTYALRLVEVAAVRRIDLSGSKLRAIIVGAEPGGSIPAVRAQIESAWPGARLHDHYGMTEAGAVTFQCPDRADVMHATESLYLVEVVDSDTGAPIEFDGRRTGELVLTTLGRADSPVLRYRTGDVVCPLPRQRCACGRHEIAFVGGVIGRADDMVHLRGVNLYPSAVDAIVRDFGQVIEYRARVHNERGMTELDLDIELQAGAGVAVLSEIAAAFRATHGLRIGVHAAEPGSLPRFEFKARRWSRE